MFLPAEVWYCCLTDEDKAAVASTAALYLALLNQPIELTTFEAVWAITLGYQIAGLDFVLATYALENTFIVIPDEPPIPAVGITDLLLWLNIQGFILVGGADCPEGCDAPSWSIQK